MQSALLIKCDLLFTYKKIIIIENIVVVVSNVVKYLWMRLIFGLWLIIPKSENNTCMKIYPTRLFDISLFFKISLINYFIRR